MRPPVAFLFLFLLSLPAFSETRWLRGESAHFEIYSSAGERDSTETLRQFEKVREFFLQAIGTPETTQDKTRLIVFGSGKDYEPYKLKGFAAAWYMQGRERDCIVIGNSGAGMLPLAVHEYVHLLTRRAGLDLPPWLNEGVAELYSTLEARGDKVLVGTLIPGRMQGVLREKWKMREVLAAGPSSPLYNEKSRVSAIYNVGWALTHMLALSEDYRGRFSALLDAILKGQDSIAAIRQVYQLSPEALEDKLLTYLGGSSFQGSLFGVKLANVKDKWPLEPAPAFDTEMALLEISGQSDTAASRKARYLKLIEEHPERPEPEAGLGYLLLQEGESGLARLHMEQAVTKGSRAPRVLYDYGLLGANDNPALATTALRTLLELAPAHIDARLQLAALELQSKKHAEALAALGPVKKVSKRQAPRYFRLLAYAQLESGLRKEATANALRWKENAESPQDAEAADRLLVFLGRGDLPTASQREGEVTAATPEPAPRVRRAPERATQAEPPAEIPSTPEPTGLKGDFVELTCLGAHAVLRLQTPQGRKSFVIRDGSAVDLQGTGNAKQEFDCGRRPVPAKVEVFFEPESGYDGRLTVLKFLPR
jgi:hypothetical protein